MLVIFIIFLIGSYSDLLRRFTQALAMDFDFSNSRFTLALASGRIEEVLGIINYFNTYPQYLIFGSPPGAFYEWYFENVDYLMTKNYAHINFFGYLFRYGIIFSTFIYLTFLIILFKYWSPKNSIFLVFVGIFLTSFLEQI